MKFIRRNKESGNKLSGWRVTEGGFDQTEAGELIDRVLEALVREKKLFSLADANYLSTPTLLKSYDGRELVIDRTDDWPEGMDQVRVLFKDADRLWNYFDVKVVRTGPEDIVTGRPVVLHRVQRRDHYRLIVPGGSEVEFDIDGEMHAEFVVQDISAGGALIASQRRPAIEVGTEIEKIRIRFRLKEKEPMPEKPAIEVARARVQHKSLDERREYIRYGIEFKLDPTEREELARVVRRMELELLRKWAE